MSNIVVRGWDWLEAELHKALSLVHHTHVPAEAPAAAKAAVSAVLEAAKVEALACAAPVVEQVAVEAVDEILTGVNGVGQPAGDLLEGLKGEAAAEGAADVADGEG